MLIPPINSSGRFKLKAPLNTLLRDDIDYTVISIRSIHELIQSDEDVLNLVYLVNGLSESDFTDDIDNDVPIVVLSSPDGDYIYVPADMFLSIPDITGVLYKQYAISVNLGYIRESMDLTNIANEIKDLVLSTLGIDATVEVIPLSNSVVYTYDDDAVLEASRVANISNSMPCRAQLQKALSLIEDYKLKIKTLLGLR